MTKNDLVEAVAQKEPAWTKKNVEHAVNSVFRSLAEALKNNERIEIRGLGSFRVKERKPRAGRNPKTGDIVSIPERLVPVFTVGKELKARVDQAPTA